MKDYFFLGTHAKTIFFASILSTSLDRLVLNMSKKYDFLVVEKLV